MQKMIKTKYSRSQIGQAFQQIVKQEIDTYALEVVGYFDYYTLRHRGYAVLTTLKNKCFDLHDENDEFYFSYVRSEFPAVESKLYCILSDEEMEKFIDAKEAIRVKKYNLITRWNLPKK
jgi:hypothetical protein